VATAIKHPVPDRAKKPSFVIFDIRALWRSTVSRRHSAGKSIYKRRLNPVRHTIMLYSCTHMATVGVKGLITPASGAEKPPAIPTPYILYTTRRAFFSGDLVNLRSTFAAMRNEFARRRRLTSPTHVFARSCHRFVYRLTVTDTTADILSIIYSPSKNYC